MRHPNDRDTRDQKNLSAAIAVLKRAESSFQKKAWMLLDSTDALLAKEIADAIEKLWVRNKPI